MNKGAPTGYSRKVPARTNSSTLKQGGANVLEKSSSGVKGIENRRAQSYQGVTSPPQIKGRSKLSNGITTKLLRYGTDSEKAERRKLLEEEKVLQLRAALLLSISRKPEKIDVEKLKEEIRKLDIDNPENSTLVEHGKGETTTVVNASPVQFTGQKHHYELDTLESKASHTVSEDIRKELQKIHRNEYSHEHSHNMAGVRPFRAPNPYTDHVAQVADKRIEAAKLSNHKNH